MLLEIELIGQLDGGGVAEPKSDRNNLKVRFLTW